MAMRTELHVRTSDVFFLGWRGLFDGHRARYEALQKKSSRWPEGPMSIAVRRCPMFVTYRSVLLLSLFMFSVQLALPAQPAAAQETDAAVASDAHESVRSTRPRWTHQ
jgi:hypothetical protein